MKNFQNPSCYILEKINFWLSWCIKDLWGTKVMFCYAVKWPFFRLHRGSAKSPLAPSVLDLLGNPWCHEMIHKLLFLHPLSNFVQILFENVMQVLRAFHYTDSLHSFKKCVTKNMGAQCYQMELRWRFRDLIKCFKNGKK